MERDAEASTSRGATHTPPRSNPRKRSRRNYDVEDRTTKTDVGSAPGTSWTLSSYKPGSGVGELRSADLSKLWQSDGSQPHLINIQFARRTCVTHLSIFLDVKQDDSYTPTKISVKAGTNYHDLTLVRQRTFEAPQGWKHFSMTPGSVDAVLNEEDEEEGEGEEEEAGATGGADGESDDDEDGATEGIRVWLIQVCILANHLNGKDTHIRRLIVFGPKPSTAAANPHYPGAKRSASSSLAQSMPPHKTRGAPASSGTANGHHVTLAQLLAVQAASSGEAEEAEDESAAGLGQRRSGLSLFGNIR
ncbi:related to anaphase promoting complex subunit 10 [Sporisorium reilianum SRZ2]|uniref:Related to anaphase promoting complex subunit 10 n=2 Tax=Sporisorium reilianum TaxID=72558 RepID=E6ZL99_SPORE|nr:related to anaphase promoting complex subunit 10 [Sporisorium reilianum SRZ2]SJX60741.1 related to anaphase promoting complex subunit 10 [Sporisorium reilianum f. sp. reilianum]